MSLHADPSKTPRGAILVFLLMQATHLCPEVEGKIGLSHPLSQCVLFCGGARSIPVLIL